jgi:hypothetical protein
MVFSIVDYEKFNNELLSRERTFILNAVYEKIGNTDSLASMQTFIMVSKFGELALNHKKLILEQYNKTIDAQIKLMGQYLAIIEAGAGNISPAGNITGILTAVINFINLSALLMTLGDLQGDFRTYAEKPLIAYISEIMQATESIKDNNLNTAYNQLQNAYMIPDKIF